jgi:hypothetical protein
MLDLVTIRAAQILQPNHRITVSDLSGRLVWESNGNGSREISFSSENLQSGIYIYRVSSGNAVHSGKLIKP